MAKILELLSNGSFWAAVMFVVFIVQGFLVAMARWLESFKDQTVTEVDNKAHTAITKTLTFIDTLTGNREHPHVKPDGSVGGIEPKAP